LHCSRSAPGETTIVTAMYWIGGQSVQKGSKIPVTESDISGAFPDLNATSEYVYQTQEISPQINIFAEKESINLNSLHQNDYTVHSQISLQRRNDEEVDFKQCETL
jgi:hypothetical protein